MATVKDWFLRNRKRICWTGGAFIVLCVLVVAGYLWTSSKQSAPARRNTPQETRSNKETDAKTEPAVKAADDRAGTPPPATPSSEVPAGGTSATGTRAAAPAGATSANPPPSSPPPATARPSGSEPAAATPIAVEANGRLAELDVQSIMALQRDHAQRRLYDRVSALSASVLASTPALGLAPVNRANPTAMGTLMGDGRAATINAASTVGNAPLPSGQPVTPAPVVPGSLQSGLASSADTIRLVSVFSRGDLQIAELKLGSGRRQDIETDETFMGKKIVSISEEGVTFSIGTGKTGRQVFVPVGGKLPETGQVWSR